MRWPAQLTGVFSLSLTLVMGAPSALAQGREPSPSQPRCGEKASFWRKPVAARSADYCRLVLRARANLWSDLSRSSEASKAALKKLPAGIEAQLLLAQAELLQGRYQASRKRFKRTWKKAPVRLLSPSVRVSAARAALLSTDYGAALRLYRSALLHLPAIPSEREQARILIEAGVAASYASASGGREARTYLRLARTKQEPLLSQVLDAALVLSLLRDNRTKQARRVAAGVKEPFSVVWILDGRHRPNGRPGEVLPLLPPGEQHAFIAGLLSLAEPESAEEHWQNFARDAGDSLPDHLKRPEAK